MILYSTRLLFICLFLAVSQSVFSQRETTVVPVDSAKLKTEISVPTLPSRLSRTALKPYKDIVSSHATTSSGMFKVHKADDKWYFEIPDSLLDRDILTVARISKSAVGVRSGYSGYAGDEISQNLVQFQKGPNNKLFIRSISYQETGRDSISGMYWNVINSNMQPIIYAFDIKALAPDSNGVVIDVTDLINGDNELLYFDGSTKRTLGITGLQSDKSYVTSVNAFSGNIEMKTVKTYGRSSGGSRPGSAPDNSRPSNATFELNSSIVLLPKEPMQPRYFDDRVGYITTDAITDYDLNPQGIEKIRFIRRFRLEPKPEDMEKYLRGELVEPARPIVYYIDPTTPRKWIPYLIQGVNDWQVAFEKAGFKNAIIGKEAPNWWQDSTWNIDDASHNAIVYKPSDVTNASGPSIIDPRSGEIIEAHINWYHNLMKLLHDWYFVQTAAVDSRARKTQFDDDLMGQLIRFACSHEVGHTLGLMHNFGASSTVPVEKLRDKNYVEKYGPTPSIMDYARFNYVAQPEDSIAEAGLLPKIGVYDIWAIEWGYRLFPQYKTPEGEEAWLNKWVIERMNANKQLFWGDGENYRGDPRSQSEDLGDNAMMASTYGVKNLKRIVKNLPEWTKEPDKDYNDLSDMYARVVSQFANYCDHVISNIGGIERTPKRVEQPGPVYVYTKKNTQRQAIKWLSDNVFTTPVWLVNSDITRLTNQSVQNTIPSLQDRVLNNLLGRSTITRLLRFELDEKQNAYSLLDMMGELRRSIYSELSSKQPIEMYRRTLQKSFVEKLIGLTDTQSSGIVLTIGGGGASVSQGMSKTSDAISIAKATLRQIDEQIKLSLSGYTDVASKYHLLDVRDRIKKALDPS